MKSDSSFSSPQNMHYKSYEFCIHLKIESVLLKKNLFMSYKAVIVFIWEPYF